jgi:hypothetical protein
VSTRGVAGETAVKSLCDGRSGHTLMPEPGTRAAKGARTVGKSPRVVRHGLPVLMAILVLLPRVPAPPDPPHLDERDDDRRQSEIFSPPESASVNPGVQPDQSPLVQ